jgi:Fic family protein
MSASLPFLPPDSTIVLETTEVLRQAVRAHRSLAELKGAVTAIPNAAILVNTLALQEARDSSAIENIVTTQDELYRSESDDAMNATGAAKEVHRYAQALHLGFDLLKRNGMLRTDDILAIHEVLCRTRMGFRKLPGTVLMNSVTNQVVYEPPQDPAEIERLISNFLDWFHESERWNVDPLVQMAVLHYQFESIHPFYDGNGRTGRILNLLHMSLHGLLDLPVLYLSQAIVRRKDDYYRHLQAVREHGAWEEWILYMLGAVESTARNTLQTVNAIRSLMSDVKHRLRTEQPKIYSQELLNNLFRHPYTRLEFVMDDCTISRPTAIRYLAILELMGIISKVKVGRSNLYVNNDLVKILT